MIKKMEKPTLVYFNPDCFTQVDDTVLHHLVDDFHVIWLYLYESEKSNSMRYNPDSAQRYADKYGIQLVIVDPKMRRRNPKNILFFRKVAKQINNYKPDIVYSCCIFPFWTFCYNLIKCENKVLGIHDVSLHSYKFSLSKLWIQHNKEKWIRRFGHIFTFSKNQHDLLLNRHGKESCMVGMSYKNFGISHITPPPFENKIKLLFFGSIAPYKGLDLLIDAMEQLYAEGINNIQLTIAGRGESWEECKSHIKTTGLYSFQVRFIDNAEIPDLMNSHHFLVLPYRNATQSGPLVTAVGYNLPVIAPRYGCFSDILTEKSAILYEQAHLIDALRMTSSMKTDAYKKIKSAISLLKDDYSEERVAKNYLEEFNRILDGNN